MPFGASDFDLFFTFDFEAIVDLLLRTDDIFTFRTISRKEFAGLFSYCIHTSFRGG